MKKILETERLILRELVVNDAENLWKLNSDKEVIKFTGDSSFKSMNQAKIFLQNYQDYKTNGFGRWAVVFKESLEFIGWCGLKLNEEKEIDIGFRFFRKHWNKGYATESAMAVIEYGFKHLDIREIIGRSAIENAASVSVLKKLNMEFYKIGNCEGIKNSVYYRINKEHFNQAESL